MIPDLWNIVLQYLDDDIQLKTSEFFEKHVDKISWEGLSLNESIPIQFFEKHLDKISWESLSRNTNIVKQEIRMYLLQNVYT